MGALGALYTAATITDETSLGRRLGLASSHTHSRSSGVQMPMELYRYTVLDVESSATSPTTTSWPVEDVVATDMSAGFRGRGGHPRLSNSSNVNIILCSMPSSPSILLVSALVFHRNTVGRSWFGLCRGRGTSTGTRSSVNVTLSGVQAGIGCLATSNFRRWH